LGPQTNEVGPNCAAWRSIVNDRSRLTSSDQQQLALLSAAGGAVEKLAV
jgi:hypothetical protein